MHSVTVYKGNVIYRHVAGWYCLGNGIEGNLQAMKDVIDIGTHHVRIADHIMYELYFSLPFLNN